MILREGLCLRSVLIEAPSERAVRRSRGVASSSMMMVVLGFAASMRRASWRRDCSPVESACAGRDQRLGWAKPTWERSWRVWVRGVGKRLTMGMVGSGSGRSSAVMVLGSARWSARRSVDLPEPDGPVMRVRLAFEI